jgi:hypothetical protein
MSINIYVRTVFLLKKKLKSSSRGDNKIIMENIDERAKKFFRYSYIGKNTAGANSEGCRYNWNSTHEDLTPTRIYSVGGSLYCAYCNQKAYPIQAGLTNNYHPTTSNYQPTGYTCVCKKAMDEVELSKRIEAANQDYRQLLSKLRSEYDLSEDLDGRTQKFVDYVSKDLNIVEFVKSYRMDKAITSSY